MVRWDAIGVQDKSYHSNIAEGVVWLLEYRAGGTAKMYTNLEKDGIVIWQ